MRQASAVKWIFCSMAMSLLFGVGGAAQAGPGDDCSCLKKCPPRCVHCQEGPPRLKIKCGCPKPICDPCTLQSWGYYQNLWYPWPWPTNWSHCRDGGCGAPANGHGVVTDVKPVEAH